MYLHTIKPPYICSSPQLPAGASGAVLWLLSCFSLSSMQSSPLCLLIVPERLGQTLPSTYSPTWQPKIRFPTASWWFSEYVGVSFAIYIYLNHLYRLRNEFWKDFLTFLWNRQLKSVAFDHKSTSMGESRSFARRKV